MWTRGKVFLKDASTEVGTRLRKVAEEGNHKGVRLLQHLKASASAKTPTRRTSNPGPGAGELHGASPGSASSSATRRGQSSSPAGPFADDPGIAALCRLGFSPAAAVRALERCHGNLEEAGEWLLDSANADEIFAAELQAQADAEPPEARAGEGLQPGCIARIVGLRGAPQLNGTLVALLAWEEGSQRWVVEAPGGARKAIRPRNLQAVQIQEPASEPSVATPVAAPRSQSSACAAARPEDDDALAGLEVDPELREALAGLSPAQVQEIMGGGGGKTANSRKAFEPPPRRPPAQAFDADVLASQERALAAAKADSGGFAAAGADRGAEELWRLEAEEERIQLLEAEQMSRASGLEAQEAWRTHANAEVARLEALESQCAALETDMRQRSQDLLAGPGSLAKAEPAELQILQAEVLSMTQEFDEKQRLDREKSQDEEARQASLETLSQRHASELAECEAHLRRAAVAQEAQASEPHMPVTAGDSADLGEQHAELRALQEEVQQAARDLEEQREQARWRAEALEVQLLEQDLEQRRTSEELLQEKAWLQRQKRSTLAMQAAAKQMMESAPSTNTGAFRQDGTFSCARAKLDEADCVGEDESDTAAEDADSEEIWDLDYDWSTVRPRESDEEEQQACEPVRTGEAESGIAGDPAPAIGDDAGLEEAGSTLPLKPGQAARLTPGQTLEESEDDECTLEDIAIEARTAASSSPSRRKAETDASAPGVQPQGDPETAASPARAEPA